MDTTNPALQARTTIHEALQTIETHEDLKMVSKLVKERWDELSAAKKRAFSVGDSVYFNSKREGRVYGTVTKINPKTIVVKESEGDFPLTWRVAPSLLHHAG